MINDQFSIAHLQWIWKECTLFALSQVISRKALVFFMDNRNKGILMVLRIFSFILHLNLFTRILFFNDWITIISNECQRNYSKEELFKWRYSGTKLMEKKKSIWLARAWNSLIRKHSQFDYATIKMVWIPRNTYINHVHNFTVYFNWNSAL